ncbi:Snf7-domain-containing protein [Schizopora paradoxa]|uniref:Vacuolar-sorting protein SNF7 n=1 Tax=Schizopora paradoxa TaxID=27342 RepID=A0A0H2RZT5_9AGAM|nr:Snf7-domain-containing protein [Schizopora paradoxa]
MSYLMNFFGRKDDKALIQKTIIDLRQQVNTLEKKEEFCNKKIEEEERIARENAVKKKNIALAALKNKKRLENDLIQIAGKKEVLERQLSAIEDANLNKEVFKTMQRSGEVLKTIHGSLTVDKVDSIMSSINEQREIANEISEAISNPLNNGIMEDEDELKNELAELEQDVLNERLAGAEHVPTTSLASPLREDAPSRRVTVEEEDEDAELKALQAELAM